MVKKVFSTLLLGSMAFSTVNAASIDIPIEIRNTHASFVNGGMCSLAFDLSANDALENIEKIDFSFSMKDKNGKLISNETATADDFNFVGGKTYSGFFIEGESACDAFSETLIVNKAIVSYNDRTKPEDIVKTKKLIIDDFKPMKIIVGKGK